MQIKLKVYKAEYIQIKIYENLKFLYLSRTSYVYAITKHVYYSIEVYLTKIRVYSSRLSIAIISKI
jgi:hypothetical protein